MTSSADDPDLSVDRTQPRSTAKAFETLAQLRIRNVDPPGEETENHALRPGTRLHEFEVLNKIGEGGFSIVYLAWDHSLDRKVALKEYMPSSIARRRGETEIFALSQHHESFEAGLKSFVNEGKLLAQFDHPSLVKVYRFWQSNGTAYMVMPFYEGSTLRNTVRALPAPPDEAWIRRLLLPLMEALEIIHAENCYHRDIAPDNILLPADGGNPVLLDFGAARRVITDMTQSLTVILKPGYAPVEQYADTPDMIQGPWTDVYALAAVVFWCVTGKPPPPSFGRLLHDTMVPLSQHAGVGHSYAFLAAVDRALRVRPSDRTQTIGQFREQLDAAAKLSSEDPDATVLLRRSRPFADRVSMPTDGMNRDVVSTPGAPWAAGAGGAPAGTRAATTRVAPAATPMAVAVRHAAGDASVDKVINRTALIGVALLMLGAGAWWLLPSLEFGSGPVAPPRSDDVPTKPATPIGPSDPIAAPLPAPPRSPEEALALASRQQDPTIRVELKGPSQPILVGGDPLRISLASNQSGALYLLGAREGTDTLVLLRTSLPSDAGSIESGKSQSVSLASWGKGALKPGNWKVVAMVTENPRIFEKGWRLQGNDWTFDFDVANGEPIGTTQCTQGRNPCSARYGIGDFRFELKDAPPIPKPAIPDRQLKNEATVGAATQRGTTSSEKKPVRRQAPECASILQELSLGAGNTEALQKRLESLDCRGP